MRDLVFLCECQINIVISHSIKSKKGVLDGVVVRLVSREFLMILSHIFMSQIKT